MVAFCWVCGMTKLRVWSREEFEKSPKDSLGRASQCKPKVYRVVGPSGPCVVKDVSEHSLFGRFLGRWLLAREVRALIKLVGVEGVPQILFRNDKNAIAFQILFFTMALIYTSIGIYFVNIVSYIYVVGAIILGLIFLFYSSAILFEYSSKRIKRIFIFSIIYLPILLIMIILDSIFFK